MSLSTHVLDTATGRPVVGIGVRCERRLGEGWETLSSHSTDGDGRVGDLVARADLEVGDHRLVFAVGEWAATRGTTTFYPEVAIAFTITEPDEHHHVPLLLSPYGYSTYRGS